MDETNEITVNENSTSVNDNAEQEEQEATIFEYREEGTIQSKKNYTEVLLSFYEMTKIDEELAEIVNNKQSDYQPEAIKAAEQEIKKRELNTGKFSKYSDEQILEILTSRNDYQPYEVAKAEAEAEKRKNILLLSRHF